MTPKDTTLEALRIQFSILRRIGMKGRAERTAELSDGLRSIVESGIKLRHPDFTPEETAREVLRLTAGPNIFSRLYPYKDNA